MPHHQQLLVKPDGRKLTLYGVSPIQVHGPVPSAGRLSAAVNPHLRWHPLRGEWIAIAAHRQDRTFLPPPEYNPLLPSSGNSPPTELPEGRYDMAVFDNLFPSMLASAHDAPQLAIETAPARGQCEVVVFSQDASTSLGSMPAAQLELLLWIWGQRTESMAAGGAIRYVLPFENRGVEVGVTLNHPHGQIYGYPFVPPVPARMNAMELEHFKRTRRPLLRDLIDHEIRAGSRMLYAGRHAVAFVPEWARYAYEICVAPRRACAWLHELDDAERTDLALALKHALQCCDGLWSRPFPYVMAWFQAPVDGEPHPEAHLHAELYPAYRSRERLKYLAGTEIAAGMFANDRLPEDCAAELRAVLPPVFS